MKMNETHRPCEPPSAPHLYKIGLFAQMNHLTVKALRFYEEQGLLQPAHVDRDSGYRYYTMSQMAQVHQITALKQAGFSLENIRQIRSGADAQTILSRRKAELMEKIAELTRQVALLEGYGNLCSDTLSAPVLVRTIPGCIVASMRRRISSYDALFTIMPEMGAEMERLGCECALPEYCFTRYLEPGYQESDIPVEICESVTKQLPDSDKLTFQALPPIQAACIYHRGSYATLPQTYAAALQFVEANGYEICGCIRENYIDGVWNKESEEEWLTEIQIPVSGEDSLC